MSHIEVNFLRTPIKFSQSFFNSLMLMINLNLSGGRLINSIIKSTNVDFPEPKVL